MQRGVRFGKKLAEFLEIPQDIVLDLPRLTMVGNIEITLENHRGIIEYLPERIRLALPQGELMVSGEELVLVSLAQEEVVIRGCIKRLELA
ncbi:MAG TPA: sporulation protein YqfC [Firmicutes bacterium]|nr:sporulation protein YqfC [Bacillota bacterium]